MPNPYTYGADGSYDQRWPSVKGTTKTRLDYARAMCDYLRSALDSFMDTTLTADFGTWENPFIMDGTTGIYTWVDFTNQCERKKIGSAPGSEIDGVETGAGGVII